MKRGRLIVFEGLDRSGKSTQAEILAKSLRDEGLGVLHMNFPDRTTPIGRTIDEHLHSTTEENPRATHLLFAANRWEKRNEIEAALVKGHTVILDRYSYSGVAYSAAKGLEIEHCWSSEIGLPAPDVVLYLEASNVSNRDGFGEERYERSDFQEKVAGAYAELREENWYAFDASQAIEVIATQVRWTLLEKVGIPLTHVVEATN